MAVKLGSTLSLALLELLSWDMYWFFNDSKVSLSSCSEADGVIDGRGGERLGQHSGPSPLSSLGPADFRATSSKTTPGCL